MTARRVLALTALMLAGGGALHPCGGPAAYPIAAPFAGYGEMLDRVLGIDPYWGPVRPDQVTFAHPLQLERPEATRQMKTLVDARVGDWFQSTPSPYRDSLLRELPSVSLAGFRTALATGDLGAAEREARVVVERVLDMPPPLADVYRLPFRRAIEFLELRPVLAGVTPAVASGFYRDSAATDPTRWPEALREAARIRAMTRAELAAWADSAPRSPRAPSLRFVALNEAMKREIPNGWKEDIRRAAPPGLWQRLHGAHDRWLADFPDSPIADLVRFSRVRLYYLAGDAGPAWRFLLDYYPERRYARTIWEMRFLFANDAGPDSAVLRDARVDGSLRVALSTAAPNSAEWCARWSQAESRRPAGWAVNAQERLLYDLAQRPAGTANPAPLALPDCFPSTAAATTPFWGRMRLMALLAARREPEARAQLATLDSAPDLAPLRTRFALQDRRWVSAVLMTGLDSAAVLYLVRVLAPDSVLERLSARGPAWVRREAVLTRAIGRAAVDDWAGGATLLSRVDPARAGRWSRIAALARDTSFAGQLALARYLQRERGRLMYPRDRAWDRTVSWRRLPPVVDSASVASLPPRIEALADEPARVERHFLSSSASYLALRAYARALDRPEGTRASLAAVVREADEVYNALLQWEGFWRERLPDSPEANSIRRAGRGLRSR